MRAVTVVALAVAAAALVVSVVALREARRVEKPPTAAELMLGGIQRFQDAGNRMTPAEVKALLGEPAAVYRNNPRALCWRYTSPFEVRLCWGAERRQAWISANMPPSDSPG